MSDKEQAFNRYQNESSADTIARLERELAAARRDAERWRWLSSNCDGNEQDDFIRWLAGTVASQKDINARVDAALGSPGEPAAPKE